MHRALFFVVYLEEVIILIGKLKIVILIIMLIFVCSGCSDLTASDDTASATKHNVRLHNESSNEEKEFKTEDDHTEATTEKDQKKVSDSVSSIHEKSDIFENTDVDKLEVYYVTGVADTLELYEFPDNKSTKVESLKCGDEVRMGVDDVSGFSYVYYKAKNIWGYVNSHYLISTMDGICVPETYYVSADSTFLYSNKISDTNERVSLKKNDIIITIAQLDGDYWYVKTESEGIFGYINVSEISDKKVDTNSTSSEKKSNDKSSDSEYIIPDSNSRYLTKDDLTSLSSYELMLARNEIYARRGRKFDDTQLQNYFNSCSWYKGTISPADFNANVFNSYEKANIDLIVNYENGY